jgi:hypothetical protein
VHLGKYLKTAFINQWNMLAFVGAAAFGLISGAGDIVLPLVAAGELAYLGLLSTHPKFQKYVDAQEAKATRTDASKAAEGALERIMSSLPRESLDRFRALKSRCLELQQIAVELKQPGKLSTQLPFEDFQAQNLDRLLWIHLRLLYTEYALSRFLQKTSEKQIQDEIRSAQERINKFPGERMKKVLEDNLNTLNDRLANLQKARENYELVKLEIERLENKIRSLSELAVNRQEPDYISGQVDQVAASMLETEKTMNELQFATGLETVDEAPELLRDRAVQVH